MGLTGSLRVGVPGTRLLPVYHVSIFCHLGNKVFIVVTP